MTSYIVIMPDGDRFFVKADSWVADESGLRFIRESDVVAWFTAWHGFLQEA